MRVTVLGSGSAWSECGCNAGYLVDGRVLVDCGAPVPALVRRAETSVQEITLILLTHFHADHTFALPTVLDARAYAAQPTPGTLVVAGPVGTREYVSRLITTGYGSHARRTIEANVDPEFVVLQDGSAIELAGYRVEAHAVMHSVGPSLAYRLTDANGATVGFFRRQRAVRGAASVDRGKRALRLRMHRVGRARPGRPPLARGGRRPGC